MEMRTPIDCPLLAALKTQYEYDPETGLFRFRVKVGYKLEGQFAGSSNLAGYTQLRYRRKTLRAHRVAWAFEKGYWPKLALDHINGIRTDNRIANLREVTASQNQHNRSPSKGKTSNFKGVCKVKGTQKWKASLGFKGEVYNLGHYDTEEEAALAYNKRASELFGEYAKLNTFGDT
jgi:hypothetical protein